MGLKFLFVCLTLHTLFHGAGPDCVSNRGHSLARISYFLVTAILTGVRGHLRVVLCCTSLMLFVSVSGSFAEGSLCGF